ncbi:MAG: ArsI/CadI family heavy metal resistance metalloenzyme [Minwuia sp.]|uniref:ArsI/CadI family heavy metal resistance metalloenzyme n=1 Tax=Minwuia sp. TaxID=2493630 RepID=UPI003A87B6FB
MSRRLHVHVSVDDLSKNVAFYSTLFAQQPTVLKDDYAKWMLDDPSVNFAISNRSGKVGIDHLGFQVDTDAEVEEIEARLHEAEQVVAPQRDANCCYAYGNKSWSQDPAGVPWEIFHTLKDIPIFGSDHQPLDEVAGKETQSAGACCG